MKKLILLFIIILLFCSNVSALEIIPDAKGYGIDTYAGSGRSEGTWDTDIFYVTNRNDSGTGSFRQAVADHDSSNDPSVIIFEVSGTITLSSVVTIDGDYLTIAGQTAPSPGIEFESSTDNPMITIKASDVLIQHLRFRPGDDACGTVSNLDALGIDSVDGVIDNIIIDHNSFAWSVDELISVWGGSTGIAITNVTFRNNIFGNPLNDSCHSKGEHGYGPLVAQGTSASTGASDILFHRNLFMPARGRNPMIRTEEVLIVNNLIYGWLYQATHTEGQAGYSSTPQLLSVVGNYYLAESYTGSTEPIRSYGIGTGDLQLSSGSEVYIDDNECPGFSPCYSYSTGSDPFDDGGSDPIAWPTGLASELVSGANAKQYVLDDVGARPKDRDTVDTDFIDDAINETGTIINCVEQGADPCDDVGEYAYITRPTLAENTNDPLISTLIPADPNDDSGNGYTNLEVFLQEYAAALEIDEAPPVTSGWSPGKSDTDVDIDENIVFHITDAGDGVDGTTIEVSVEGTTYCCSDGSCANKTLGRAGTSADYTITYSHASWGYLQEVNVEIDADDLASTPNTMTTDIYSFETEVFPDSVPPSTSGWSPAKDETSVSLGRDIVVHVTDGGDGVDGTTIEMVVEGITYCCSDGGCANKTLGRAGTILDYTITYSHSDWGYVQEINVEVDADDLQVPPNTMTTDIYSFTTKSEDEKVPTASGSSGGGSMN